MKPEEAIDHAVENPSLQSQGAIEFKHVRFGYTSENH